MFMFMAMRVRNELDRFHLVKEAILDVSSIAEKGAHLDQQMDDILQKHHDFIREEGTDLPEVEQWQWEPLR